MEKTVMSVHELSEVLGVSVPTAYEIANRDSFPSIRISERRIIIPIAAFNAWLEKQILDKAAAQN